ncbi:MAG: GumC family protein [Fidelibacterota bacterium]
MMNITLSPHEQKILSIVKKHPEIISDPAERKRIAKLNNMAEKTLRNRIADLKRYGLIGDETHTQEVIESKNKVLYNNFLLFWSKRKFIVKNAIIVFWVSIIVSLLLPKWYESKAVILSSGAGKFNFLSSISPIPISDFGLSTINEDINNFITILQSRRVKEYMVNKFNLVDRYDQPDIEYAMEAFTDKMILEVTEEGTLVLSIIDKDPEMAKQMVDEALFMLDETNQQIRMEAGKYNREFLEKRLNQNKLDLEKAELELKAFQEKTGIIDLLSQFTSTMELKIQAQQQQYQSYSQIQQQELQLYTQAQQQQYQSYNSIFESYATLYANRIETEVQLTVAQISLTENNPKLLQLKQMLDEQTNQLDLLVKQLDKKLQELFTNVSLGNPDGKLQQLLSNISMSQLDSLTNFEFVVTMEELPSLGLVNVRLLREVEIQNRIQEVLIPQYEQAKLEESKNIPTLQVIDKPKVALNKTKPKRALIVIGATLMSLILSLTFVYSEQNIRDLYALIKQS